MLGGSVRKRALATTKHKILLRRKYALLTKLVKYLRQLNVQKLRIVDRKCRNSPTLPLGIRPKGVGIHQPLMNFTKPILLDEIFT